MNEMKFESGLTRLEEIITLMEDPSCGIDAMIAYYKEASELSKLLNDKLKEYELVITELVEAD